MPVQHLVTLSIDGIIRDPVQKADRLLAYFFVNDYHQSNNQLGLIATLPGIIQERGNRPDLVAQSIQTTLDSLFSNYYDSVTCNVTVKNSTETTQTGNDLNCDLQVRLTFRQGGKAYELAKIASIVNSKLSQVAEVTNG